MIIGDGDIGSVLPKREDLLFFASGVSNSQETRKSEYERELALFNRQDRSKHIVYFSTLAIFYSDTRYTRHKRYMEAQAKRFKHYAIIRIGNILWGSNPYTLINYLKAHPEAQIRDEYRYIIDEDEFLHWVNLIPAWSVEMNITGERLKVKEIYEKYIR